MYGCVRAVSQINVLFSDFIGHDGRNYDLTLQAWLIHYTLKSCKTDYWLIKCVGRCLFSRANMKNDRGRRLASGGALGGSRVTHATSLFCDVNTIGYAGMRAVIRRNVDSAPGLCFKENGFPSRGMNFTVAVWRRCKTYRGAPREVRQLRRVNFTRIFEEWRTYINTG